MSTTSKAYPTGFCAWVARFSYMKNGDTIRNAEAPASPDGYRTSEATSRSNRVKLEFTSKGGGVPKKANSRPEPGRQESKASFSRPPRFPEGVLPFTRYSIERLTHLAYETQKANSNPTPTRPTQPLNIACFLCFAHVCLNQL